MMSDGDKNNQADIKAIENDEEFIDETLAERLMGLTEMFPESVRNVCSTITDYSWKTTKFCFGFSQSAIWIVASSFTVLALPVVIEMERNAMQEQQQMQQRQILMGTNQAMSGSQNPNIMGMMPPALTAPPPQ